MQISCMLTYKLTFQRRRHLVMFLSQFTTINSPEKEKEITIIGNTNNHSLNEFTNKINVQFIQSV